MSSCLLIAPLNDSGMGTQGFFWSRSLLPLLIQKGLSIKLMPNGDASRTDPLLLQHLENPMPSDGVLDLSVILCLPAQFDSIPGRITVAYIVFEGSRIPKGDLEYLQKLHALAVPSAWAKKVLEDSFKFHQLARPKNIFIWPEGVEPSIYFPSPERGPLFDSQANFTFGNIGKLERRKGTEELIQVFAKLAREFPQKKLRLLAHWNNHWQPDWLKDARGFLKSAGFENESAVNGLPLLRFHLQASYVDLIIGPLKQAADVVALYRASDFGVFPYFAEGWCLPLIEMMACAIPCIATSYSGPTEFLKPDLCLPLKNGQLKIAKDNFGFTTGEHGDWCEVNQAELFDLMSQAIKMSASDRSDLGLRASTYVRDHFSWAESAQKTFKDLETLLMQEESEK